MRRILLVLAVALAMVVIAIPSAVAQTEPTQYCLSGMEFNPGGRGNCYASLEECLANMPFEGGCSEVPQSLIGSGYGRTSAD
jgi:Protein of unknown function (DUF3551)